MNSILRTFVSPVFYRTPANPQRIKGKLIEFPNQEEQVYLLDELLEGGIKIPEKILESIRKAKMAEGEEQKIIIKTHARNAIVFPEMVGFTILVHNGKKFNPVEIIPEMIGHYLGEFAITNEPVKHGSPGIGASRSSMYVPLR